MVRRGDRSPDDDEDDDLDEEEDDSPPARRSATTRGSSKTRRRRGRPKPVREWKASDDDLEPSADELPDEPAAADRPRKTVYWRARDSLFFEPLVALAVIVVLLVALFAYTQNWPPVYVIESDSMQHGANDVVGLVNTGDLVLAQKISADDITPYLLGMQTGYSTYGEYGDVLLYHPNGGGTTPIIHRAILELFYNSTTATYSAPVLDGLKCGSWVSGANYLTPGCATTGLVDVTLNLFHIGWRSANLSIDLTTANLGTHSGFLTAGDNNFLSTPCSGTCQIFPDEPAFTSLVEPSWVIGAARGMLPWFGAFKLLITNSPNLSKVPSQSWQYMGITLAAVILGALGLHYLFRAEGIETDLRRREEEETAELEGDDEVEEEGRRRRWLRSLRPWKRSDDDEPEPDDPPKARRKPPAPPDSGLRRGRPRPRVRRDPKKKKGGSDDDGL